MPRAKSKQRESKQQRERAKASDPTWQGTPQVMKRMTRWAGRDAETGEKLRRDWSKEIEDECIALAKRGADIDEIAVIVDLRPGQVRLCYGKVIDRELALLNLEVEEAMYRNANGVKLPDTHVSVLLPKGSRTPLITKVAMLKHYPPNVAAGQFILKNRRAAAWKDEPAVVVSRDDAAAAIRARVKEMKEAGG